MGCGQSNAENRQALRQNFIDIELLNKPRTSADSDQLTFYNNNNNNNGYKSSYEHSSASNSVSKSNQFSPFQTQMIEHTTLSVLAAPEIEMSRQQKFTECFSHIDASTFPNLPIMSMSHVGSQQLEMMNILPSQQIDDYLRFIDQILTTVVTPLNTMKIESNAVLAIDLEA